jgi:hypothetical protein
MLNGLKNRLLDLFLISVPFTYLLWALALLGVVLLLLEFAFGHAFDLDLFLKL